MSTEAKPAPTNKALFWGGWVVTVLPVLMLIMSGVMKLLKPPMVLEGFEKFGYPEHLLLPIGIIELVCTLIYIVPRTSVLGAILLTGYLGGAVATHVRVGDPYFGAVLVGVFVWLGLFLRDARLRALVPLRS